MVSAKLSKKYTFGMGSIFAVINTLWIGSYLKADHWVLVASITAITVVCVTYLTGQAKIDLQLKSDVKS